jgi:hypothetical protein
MLPPTPIKPIGSPDRLDIVQQSGRISMTRCLRPLLLLLVAGCSIAAIGSNAQAHSGKQSYIYLGLFDDGVDGRVEIPTADLASVLGLEFGASPAAAAATAEENASLIRNYVGDHFGLGQGSTRWDLVFGDVGILPEAGNYAVVPFEVVRDFDSAPRSFVVEFDAIIHANDQKDALLHIENDWGTGTFANEDDPIANFSVGRTVQEITLDDSSIVSSVLGARGVGSDAVRTNIDQILFVVALVLPVGLVLRGSTVFGRAPSLPETARRLGALLGISIVAHSLALWIVGLGIVEPSARTTSILMAAALLALAVFSVWPAARRHELVVVGALGLAQGLGLGTAFLASNLDRFDGIMPLVGFHLGVEIAIAIVAALTMAVLIPLRRTALAPVALYGTALVLCGYAVGWLIERVADTSISMEEVANPLRVWPRNLWIVLGVVVVSAALYGWTASRGRLRPIAEPPAVSDPETTARDESLVSP